MTAATSVKGAVSEPRAGKEKSQLSVVVPAWNEAAVITRCLHGLIQDASPGELEVVVVCNGCTDDTATLAARFGPPVRVLETPVGSKAHALNLGNAAATFFPRVYVDADVELDTAALRALAAPLKSGSAMAVAPAGRLDLTGTSRLVRAYCRVWAALPQSRNGLMGRGVYALSKAGHERLGGFPDVIADDLLVHRVFRPPDGVTVHEVVARPHAARTVRELVRRKTRVFAGNRQLVTSGLTTDEGGRLRALLAAVRWDPGALPGVPIYLAVNSLAKVGARMGRGSSIWLREDASRDVAGSMEPVRRRGGSWDRRRGVTRGRAGWGRDSAAAAASRCRGCGSRGRRARSS